MRSKGYLYRYKNVGRPVNIMCGYCRRPFMYTDSVQRIIMKARRQSAILDVVEHGAVRSQEQLRQRLASRGFDVTQATLSRDIKELGLLKRSSDGAYRASTADDHVGRLVARNARPGVGGIPGEHRARAAAGGAADGAGARRSYFRGWRFRSIAIGRRGRHARR